MTLMTALNHSRNIPAIKLYFLAGEQKGIIDYLKST
jgi:membrane peptidoglycan carboxypeptidase